MRAFQLASICFYCPSQQTCSVSCCQCHAQALNVSQAPSAALPHTNSANNNTAQQPALWQGQHGWQLPQGNLHRPASLAQQLRSGAAGTAAWRQPPPYSGPRPEQLTQQQQQQQVAQQSVTLNAHDNQHRFLQHQEQTNAAGPAEHISRNEITGTAAGTCPGTAATGHQQQQQPEQLTQLQSPHDFQIQLQLAQQQAQQHAAAAAQLKHQVRLDSTVLQLQGPTLARATGPWVGSDFCCDQLGCNRTELKKASAQQPTEFQALACCIHLRLLYIKEISGPKLHQPWTCHAD